MTPNKPDACRKELETLLEYDMITQITVAWWSSDGQKERRSTEILLRLSIAELRLAEGCLSHT